MIAAKLLVSGIRLDSSKKSGDSSQTHLATCSDGYFIYGSDPGEVSRGTEQGSRW
jgi:hypothetical protein